MPHSWIKVSTRTSSRLRSCMGDDHSRDKFESCLNDIVNDDRGSVEQIHYEVNGKWARVYLEWPDVDSKAKIIFDLQAEDVIDTLSRTEIEKFGP
jgi:hypothetical protein